MLLLSSLVIPLISIFVLLIILTIIIHSVIVVLSTLAKHINNKNMKTFLVFMFIITIMRGFTSYSCTILDAPLLRFISAIPFIIFIWYIKSEFGIYNKYKIGESIYMFMLFRTLYIVIALCIRYFINESLGSALLVGDIPDMASIFIVTHCNVLPGTDPRRITTVLQLINMEVFSCNRDVEAHFRPKIDSVRQCSRLSESFARPILYAVDRHGVFLSRSNGNIFLNIPFGASIRRPKRREIEAALPLFLAVVDRNQAIISGIHKDISEATCDTTTSRWDPNIVFGRVVGDLSIAQRSPRTDRLRALIP